jgi:microcystin-dependent protein
MAFAGQVDAAPGQPGARIESSGWMACDGRALRIADYPELYAVLGTLYGRSGADSFYIPDYRGTFLRGVDGGRGMDPDAGARRPAPQGSPAGIGSTQDCAVQAHEHNYWALVGAAGTVQGGTIGLAGPTRPFTTGGGPVPGQGSSPPVRTSAAETRPANIYVAYIIKFTTGLGHG